MKGSTKIMIGISSVQNKIKSNWKMLMFAPNITIALNSTIKLNLSTFMNKKMVSNFNFHLKY
jgi:hypothetical protein